MRYKFELLHFKWLWQSIFDYADSDWVDIIYSFAVLFLFAYMLNMSYLSLGFELYHRYFFFHLAVLKFCKN